MIGILDAANYAFAYGLVSAMPQYLGSATYAAILGVDTLDAALVQLVNTHYRETVQEVMRERDKTINIAKIERGITDHYTRICMSVVDALPMGIRASSKAILTSEFDVMNLKKILRGIIAKKNPEIIISECVAGNIKDEILRDLANSEFSSAVEKIKNLGFNIQGKNLFEIENALDINLMDKWKREAEKIKAATNYIGRQIDMLNLKSVIRLKLMNRDANDFINKTYEGMFLKKNILSSINALEIDKTNFNSEGINNIIRVTPYEDRFKEALEDYKESRSLEKLELMIENASAKFGLVQNPLSLDYILSYLKRMWFDVRNIRIMLVGKKYKLPKEEIEKLLVIPE